MKVVPPYYAVIFTSHLNQDTEGYAEMAKKMHQLAQEQEGFLGMDSARDGVGITVSYWKNLEAIKKWKAHSDHQLAQEKGRTQWYAKYTVRIARVEKDYSYEGASDLPVVD